MHVGCRRSKIFEEKIDLGFERRYAVVVLEKVACSLKDCGEAVEAGDSRGMGGGGWDTRVAGDSIVIVWGEGEGEGSK